MPHTFSSAGGRECIHNEAWKAAGENCAQCIEAWGSVEQLRACEKETTAIMQVAHVTP